MDNVALHEAVSIANEGFDITPERVHVSALPLILSLDKAAAALRNPHVEFWPEMSMADLYIEPDTPLNVLLHELMHARDRFDPQFLYGIDEMADTSEGTLPLENATRLWDLHIDARLTARELPPGHDRGFYQQMFLAAPRFEPVKTLLGESGDSTTLRTDEEVFERALGSWSWMVPDLPEAELEVFFGRLWTHFSVWGRTWPELMTMGRAFATAVRTKDPTSLVGLLGGA